MVPQDGWFILGKIPLTYIKIDDLGVSRYPHLWKPPIANWMKHWKTHCGIDHSMPDHAGNLRAWKLPSRSQLGKARFWQMCYQVVVPSG